MASGPINPWQIDGETMEIMTNFIFMEYKITTAMELKRHLILERKFMTNLDSLLKSRAMTFLSKVCLVKAMVFPVIMYGCESWTVKKAEHQSIDAFELWCLRRLLRFPWTATSSNQLVLRKSVLNIHWKGWCWSSNNLAIWCEELTHWKRSWCWGRLKAEGEGDDRWWDGWMASLTQRTRVWASSRSWWWIGNFGMLQSEGLQRVRQNWVTELNWWWVCSIL